MRLGGDGRTEGQWEVGQLEVQFARCGSVDMVLYMLLHQQLTATAKSDKG